MAETIRDVTIRIGLELKKADLRVPDLSSAASSSVAKGLKQTETAAESAKTAIRDFAKETTDAYGDAKSSTDLLSKSTSSLDEKIRALEEDLESFEEALDEADKTAAETAKTLQALPGKLSQDLEGIAVGATKAARGFALLSGTDIKELVIIFAKFQGAIDVIQGVSQATRSLNSAMLAARTALTAAAAGQAAVTAGNVAIASSGALAANAMIALTAAAAPFIAIASVIGLAVANVVAWYRVWTQESRDAAEESERLLAVAKQIGEIKFSFAQSLLDNARGLLPLNQQLDRTREAIEDIENRRARLPQRESDEGAQAFSVRIRQRELEINNELAAKQASLAQIQLSQNQAKRESLELSERELETLTQQAAQEREKEQSQRAQLGALDAAGKAQLDVLLKQIEAGKTLKDLTDFQLRKLSQLGGAQVRPGVQEELAQRGAGLSERLRQAGFEGTGTDARDRLATFEDTLTTGRENVTASQAIAEGLAELNVSDAEVKKTILEKIVELTERNKEINSILQETQDNNITQAATLTNVTGG